MAASSKQTANKHKTFDLFRLPRELRDEIYDRCHTATLRKEPDEYILEASTRNASLYLVSRQFRLEYHDRARHIRNAMTLRSQVTNKHHSLEVLVACMFLPPRVKACVTQLDVSVYIEPVDSIDKVWKAIMSHANGLAAFLYSFPRLRPIELDVHTCSNGQIELRLQPNYFVQHSALRIWRNYTHTSWDMAYDDFRGRSVLSRRIVRK